MKKIEQNKISETYVSVVLRKKELKDIIEILTKYENPAISCDGYTFDSIDELVEEYKKSNLAKLELKISSPYTSIEFSEKVYLYISFDRDTDSLAKSIFHDIDSVIKKSKKFPISYIASIKIIGTYYGLSLAIFLWILVLLLYYRTHYWVIIVFPVLFLIVEYYIKLLFKSKILLKESQSILFNPWIIAICAPIISLLILKIFS